MGGWKDICLLIFIFSRGSLTEKIKTIFKKFQ